MNNDNTENEIIFLASLYFLEILKDLKINRIEEIRAINQKKPIDIFINKSVNSAEEFWTNKSVVNVVVNIQFNKL